MKFVRAIWKLLVGIKDMLVLIFMLLFFGGLYAALSARPAPVHDGVLALNLDGPIVEQPAKASFSELAGGNRVREHRLRDLVGALDAARTDGRVKAVALDLDGFTGGGHSAMADLTDAIMRVRAAGKPVVAYGVGFTDDSYELASAASEIWLHPLGAVAIAGPGGTNLYYKGLLDKLGVTANVYRVGTYKSAVEPYIRNDMSPAARENYQALGEAMLESWLQEVHRARPKANVASFLKDMPGAVDAAGGDMAKAALDAGLVDHIGDRADFEDRLKALGGADKDATGGYRTIKLASYVSDKVPVHPHGPIGVVTIAGEIVDGTASAGTAGGDTIAREIDDGVANGIKALIVRVDSPGGSVLASERIREAIVRAKAHHIPVVVSMGSVAASGGYWVSTPGDFIFAEPSTITGSIGVFGVLPSFQGTLQKLGIGADGIKTTPLSGEPDLLRGPSADAGRLIQTGVEATYRRFLGIVAAARHKTPADVDKIAQGRVWDGGSARQLGLIDGFGGMPEATAKAAELAHLGSGDRDLRYLEPPVSVKEQLLAALASGSDSDSSSPDDAFSMLAGEPRRQLIQAIADIRMILAGPSIQARCLECGPVAPPQVTGEDRSLLQLIEAWLS
ncbi:signal peptide peptidase SppA [Sphingomonas sp.]|uniref:signal peptide peptidase SppA n=1 Tax=Sphingomonas sp. TaxID=28214 RepID=UPI0025E58408|nr:signal peptide peptidase SppA [Sphingomonas sp.]MBV9527760.1 signal peptide peptidase SppA [Sphingomonas sp.]